MKNRIFWYPGSIDKILKNGKKMSKTFPCFYKMEVQSSYTTCSKNEKNPILWSKLTKEFILRCLREDYELYPENNE